jgi:hypothetical protein
MSLSLRVKVKVMLRPTVSRQVSLAIKHHLGLRPNFYYCQTVAGLLIWGAVSDERTSLSFTIVAGSRHHSDSRVRVTGDS